MCMSFIFGAWAENFENKTKTSKVLILYLGKKNACFFFGKSFFKKYTHLSRNHVFLMLAVENNEIG